MIVEAEEQEVTFPSVGVVPVVTRRAQVRVRKFSHSELATLILCCLRRVWKVWSKGGRERGGR